MEKSLFELLNRRQIRPRHQYRLLQSLYVLSALLEDLADEREDEEREDSAPDTAAIANALCYRRRSRYPLTSF